MDRFAGGGGAVAERDQPLPFQDRNELLEAVVLLGLLRSPPVVLPAQLSLGHSDTCIHESP